jgi:RNase P subunit RPR2
MICPKCQTGLLSVIPAEIRLYRNGPRTLSHPPMTPSPDVCVCLDCGWSEFRIPQTWLSAGWLRSQRPQVAPGGAGISTQNVAIVAS